MDRVCEGDETRRLESRRQAEVTKAQAKRWRPAQAPAQAAMTPPTAGQARAVRAGVQESKTPGQRQGAQPMIVALIAI
jgi:hypothetical protein